MNLLFFENIPAVFSPPLRAAAVCQGLFRLRASFFLDAQKETKEALRGGGRIGFLRFAPSSSTAAPLRTPGDAAGAASGRPGACVRPAGDDTPQPPYARRPAQLGDSLPAPTNRGPALAGSCSCGGRRVGLPLIRPSVRTGAPIPIPSVPAGHPLPLLAFGHFPLTGGIGPLTRGVGPRSPVLRGPPIR